MAIFISSENFYKHVVECMALFDVIIITLSGIKKHHAVGAQNLWKHC